METTILIVLAVVGILIAFWATMKPILDDNRVRGKVLNFDEGMKHYYFLLPGGAERLLDELRTPTETKPLDCRLLSDELIRFSKENVEADYRLRFAEGESGVCLQIGRVAAEREKGNIPYLINTLLIRGFGAKPVDYRRVAPLFDKEEES